MLNFVEMMLRVHFWLEAFFHQADITATFEVSGRVLEIFFLDVDACICAFFHYLARHFRTRFPNWISLFTGECRAIIPRRLLTFCVCTGKVVETI